MKILPAASGGVATAVDGGMVSARPDGTVKITVGGLSRALPARLAYALQSEAARNFLQDPRVQRFLGSPSERKPRQDAARSIATEEHKRKRQDFVAALMAHGICDESRAWELARAKFPSVTSPVTHDWNPPRSMAWGEGGVILRKK